MVRLLIIFICGFLIHVNCEEESYDDLIKDIFTSSTNSPINNKAQGQSLDELINNLDKNKNNNNQDTVTQPLVWIFIILFKIKTHSIT